MALVREITKKSVPSSGAHLEVDCTFDVVVKDGVKHLQIDTYGSKGRQILGKKSQSIRLTPAAIATLKQILKDNDF